ncbi:hypothetical protein BJ508DRAFT_358425 [Ascobolus immersus RN42]|uniref:Large ribosomal subunit protein bL27m n=1 Tax=Ascobolus immersus RN42 TaxID=1160509 RepID=A0A3N4ILN5_ASCIM|nr:hypothetical protein BJ508DRAFT_358425 [Ascobolus immersus RN42]
MHLRPSIRPSLLRVAARPTLTASHPALTRPATHKASRPANKAKDGPGKRLGAKKTAGTFVRPGQIIYRQRGTLWFPGENCDMGRDHTIHAAQPGYVRYYKDPDYPTRKYIGVSLKKEWNLPTPPGAVRRRRLGMELVDYYETQRSKFEEANWSKELEMVKTGGGIGVGVKVKGEDGQVEDKGRWRSPNWLIGRVGTKEVVKAYDPTNPWLRWQRRVKAKKYAVRMRGSKSKIAGAKAKAAKKAKKAAK